MTRIIHLLYWRPIATYFLMRKGGLNFNDAWMYSNVLEYKDFDGEWVRPEDSVEIEMSYWEEG